MYLEQVGWGSWQPFWSVGFPAKVSVKFLLRIPLVCFFLHLFSKIVSIFHNSSYLLHPIASFPVGCFWYVIYGLSSFPFSNCLLLLALHDKFNFEPVLFCIPGNSNLFSPPVGFLALILISDSEWFLLNIDGPRKLFIWFIFNALLKMWC